MKMLKILISFVMVVAVVPGLNYDGYFYFQIPNVAGDFEKAKSGCNSSALAVRDSATQMALTGFLNRSNPNSLLYINIKLHRNASDTWFLFNGSRYSGQIGNQDKNPAEYKLYGYLKPNPDNKAEFYVEASNPNHLRKFICDFEGNRCHSNSTSNFFFKERCYVKYEDENLTWYKARESCFNKGGDLARFQSNESNPWIPPFSTSWLNPSLTYWVGIRYNEWSWKSPDDNEEVVNTFWSNGKPNNSNYECVCVDPNGSPAWSWTDCDCTVERPFVCLKIIPTTTATTTTVPTTDSINASMSCNSDALVFGLVLGVILPLTIVLIVLTVIIVHQQRQLREKNRSDGNVANQRLSVQDRSRMQNTVPETPYQHLQKDPEPVTTIPIYDQLNQSPDQEYESTSERT